MNLTRTRTMAGMMGAAALLAGAASAQDFCGGASANGQWVGGDEASSDVTSASAPLEQMALVLQQNEYVALFSVSAPTDVRLEAQGRGAGDPVIDLRNEAGDIVASDDDSGGSSASRLETNLQAGRYCLSVRSFDGSPLTGFVRVGRQDQEALTAGLGGVTTDPMEPTDPMDPMANGVCDVATLTRFIGTGGSIDGQLASGGATATASVDEVPTWGFTLDTATPVSIVAENADADPYITLYDSTGYYLAENDDFDGLNSRIDMAQALQPGTYCLSMSALSDTTQPITVTVSAYDAQAAAEGMYERGEASPPLDGSYPVTALGPLGNRVRQDIQSTDLTTWFSFDISQPGVVLIEAVTNGVGDPTLVLFDDFGRQVAYNDDNGETLDSLITARVQAGTYVVGVRQLGEGTQALTRMLFERYVPAQ